MQSQNLWEYFGVPMWLIYGIEIVCLLALLYLVYYGLRYVLNAPFIDSKKQATPIKEETDMHEEGIVEKRGGEDSVEEYKAIKNKNEVEDDGKYGPKTDFSKFNYEHFIEFIASVGECEVEILKASAGVGIGWINYVQLLKKSCLNNEILPFFEKILSGELSIPSPPASFADFPFLIEYREYSGKKYARLCSQLLGTPNSPLAQYSLFVREK